jgi:hypothetical protein
VYENPKNAFSIRSTVRSDFAAALTQQVIQTESQPTEISDWTLSFQPDLKIIKLQRVKK